MYGLDERDEDSVSLETLIDTIQAYDPTATTRENIKVDLFHSHLPRLADAGLIEFDERSKTIRYRPDQTAERLIAAMKRIERKDDPPNS